jgi:hypothetical protein
LGKDGEVNKRRPGKDNKVNEDSLGNDKKVKKGSLGKDKQVRRGTGRRTMTQISNPFKLYFLKKSGKICPPKKIRHMILETPDCEQCQLGANWRSVVGVGFRLAAGRFGWSVGRRS